MRVSETLIWRNNRRLHEEVEKEKMKAVAKKAETFARSFVPEIPENPQELDIPDSLVEDLVLRRLYVAGKSNLRTLSRTLKLSFAVVQSVFERLRKEQFFEVKGMQGQDYTFTLSGKGQEFARKSLELCRYSGPAPVSLAAYRNAVEKQTGKVSVNRSSLRESLSDLVLTDELLDQLGPALISQNSIFLYGPTGNGKTSIVSRLSRNYRDVIVIPYAVEVDRQIIVVYDPVHHERVDADVQGFDARWVFCRRPFVLAGGEMTSAMLELNLDQGTGVYAAPLQMKANNGMLVIDDFGRQILSPEYLLNRWIVPLDRRVDYLSLSYGVKFEIPFQMTVVFSTNIDPVRTGRRSVPAAHPEQDLCRAGRGAGLRPDFSAHRRGERPVLRSGQRRVPPEALLPLRQPAAPRMLSGRHHRHHRGHQRLRRGSGRDKPGQHAAGRH